MSSLRPFGNSILFAFLDDTGGSRGEFSERTRSGLIVPKLQATQKGERWGKVIAVGPDVEGVQVGEYILIEPLMWTRNEVFEGEKIWKTNLDKVMAVTSDVALTVQF